MTKLLGNLEKGLMIIVSAPAGTGKTTLVQKLVREFPEFVTQSISCTTRSRRKGEIDGKDYVFLTEEAFEVRKAKGAFLEYASVFGFHYGTLKEQVENRQAEGKHVVLVIDTQGAIKLRETVEGIYIFIAPPSLDALQNRLEERNTESKKSLEKRLDWARHELDQAKFYDYHIVNDNLDTAYQVLTSIIIAEEHKQ